MGKIDAPKSVLKFNQSIASDFYLLEDLLLNSDIEDNRNDISNLITVIIGYGDKIDDSGLKHDYNNAIMFLGQIQMSMDKIIEPISDCIKYFNYAKNSVTEILNIKSSYNINDIKDILIEQSFVNDIEIDMVIEDGFYNKSKLVNIKDGDIIKADKTLFIGNTLKKVYPDIKLEVRRIFQNLVKNSKEAGADKLSITFGNLIYSGKLIIKYIDNGHGMSLDTMKNSLFIQGKSTKLDSGTNKGEGMHGLIKGFNENNIELDIYSVSLNNGYIGVGFDKGIFSDIVNGKEELPGLVETTASGYYSDNFPFKTGTEFVLKFPQN